MEAWIIAKPETLMLCSDELQYTLKINNFDLLNKIKIINWDLVSHDLYKNSEKIDLKALMAQDVARKHMLGEFSNNCEVWTLINKNNDDTIEKTFERLNKIKREFRSRKWDQNLLVMVEYNEIKTPYYYSYLHVPDPQIEIIIKEFNLLGNYFSHK